MNATSYDVNAARIETLQSRVARLEQELSEARSQASDLRWDLHWAKCYDGLAFGVLILAGSIAISILRH